MTMAMDFGTCNTVLARWNAATRRVETLRLEGMTKLYRYQPPGATAERVSAVIPSLIHYGEGNTLRTGAQVENTGLTNHRGTFRWVKLDILKGNNRARRINGELITPRQAADDLIGQVLLAATGQSGEELVITVPVEAYNPYVDWLQAAVLQSFRGTVRMLDEATACILGYDTHVRQDVADVGTALLRAIEEAKIRLSGGEDAIEVTQFNDPSARLISHIFTANGLRRALEANRDTLDGRSLYQLVALTVDRSLEMAQGKYNTRKSEVKAVFMAGGSSLLLGVAGVVRNLFPGCPVHCEDPFEAIARGACRYAGEDINLALVHDYCLRS